MHSPQGDISTVQIFHDGLNDALRDCAAKFESAGYRVQFAPASGPPAVWFGHYEVVGQRAITAFAEHVAKTGQEPTDGLVLYQVPDNADNKPARESVRLLGEPFKTVICPPSVRDLYRMPFISDEATGRHFGLESIRRFVEVRLAASGAACLTGARRRADDNLRSVCSGKGRENQMSRIKYYINEREEGSSELAEQMRQVGMEFDSLPVSCVSTLYVDGSPTYGVARIREVVKRLASDRAYLKDLLPKTKLGTDIELAGGALIRPLLLDGRIGIAVQGCPGSNVAIIGSMTSDQMANLAQELLAIAQIQHTIEWLVEDGGSTRMDRLGAESQDSIPLLKDLGWVTVLADILDEDLPSGALIRVTEAGYEAARPR